MKEIKIGKKGSMTYVLEILQSKKEKIVIKARSRLIVKAVDVITMYKTHFGNLKIKDIKISSESKKDQYNNKIELSVINIVVEK